MLADELKESLKQCEPNIALIQTFWNNAHFEQQFHSLEAQTKEEEFWKNPQHASVLKELQQVKNKREQYYELMQSYKDLLEFIDLFAQDEAELQKIKTDIRQLVRHITAFKIELLLTGPHDNNNCFLNINAGAGGTEAQDWAEILLRMYVRFCEQHKYTATIIDYQAGETAGIKSATLFIKGKNAYGVFKSEHGIHRLVRISPYDANKRRHTSFAAVSVLPEAPDIEITINPQDLRIDTYRAGGAGGQHVNKTESAVRITHIPTNTVTQCQNERSQLQNKETAMKMLKAKLAQKAEEERKEQVKAGTEKKKIEWGSQIRSYVLHPYKMIKDHRTDYESPQPELVLDGDLMGFIESFLVWQGTSAASH